eukprot:1262051-Rhodomonas_salina.2
MRKSFGAKPARSIEMAEVGMSRIVIPFTATSTCLTSVTVCFPPRSHGRSKLTSSSWIFPLLAAGDSLAMAMTLGASSCGRVRTECQPSLTLSRLDNESLTKQPTEHDI